MEVKTTPEGFCGWLEKYVNTAPPEFRRTQVSLSPRLEPVAHRERTITLTGEVSQEETEAGRLILSVKSNVYPRVIIFNVLPLGDRIGITARCLYPMFGDYMSALLEAAVEELEQENA